MPKKTLFPRIAITLPREVLAAADSFARALGRSRSGLIAEAIRQFTAPRPVSSANWEPNPGLGPSRTAQLAADMKLTPEQRVREAEDTAHALLDPRARRFGLLVFGRFEDYLDWKRAQDRGA